MVGILEGRGTGVALGGFSNGELREGMKQLLALTDQAGLQQRCRAEAEELFSLEAGVSAYGAIYRSLEQRR